MQLEEFRQEINEELEESLLSPFSSQDTRLHESMYYSLSNGGKRLRPLLILALLKAFNQQVQIGLDAASAIEYVHTYSLIHDDLPGMDNDDYRRGVYTNHKKFDEATAILAGDALLTYAFERLASSVYSPEVKISLLLHLSQASGHEGMVEGQMLDMASEQTVLSLDKLRNLHQHKTGELFLFAIRTGALLAKVQPNIQKELDQFAEEFGVGFQIQNDLQEVLWSDEQRGKKGKGDKEASKNTYPSLLGVEESQKALSKTKMRAKKALERIKEQVPDFDLDLMEGFLAYLTMDKK